MGLRRGHQHWMRRACQHRPPHLQLLSALSASYCRRKDGTSPITSGTPSVWKLFTPVSPSAAARAASESHSAASIAPSR
ncbi:hypothetical protein DIPPA_28107 [Diplonema papillatum]|nr:hypothetical protein DIPPA_28107 [Diplonema papillatum]